MLILLTLREVGSLRQNTSTRTWYSSCSASLLFKASPTFQVPLRIHSEKPFSISLSPLSQSLLFGLSDMLKKRFLARKGCRIPPFSILIIVVLKFFYLGYIKPIAYFLELLLKSLKLFKANKGRIFNFLFFRLIILKFTYLCQ